MNKVNSKANSMVQNKGYGDAGASYNKRSMKGFTARSGSPTEDIDCNNYTLRQRARMLYMAAPIATSAIKTNRTNTIGLGLKLNPKIDHDLLGISAEDAEAWERNVKAEFNMWAKDKNACDATGVNDFYSMQQLAFSSWLISGDVFALRKDYKVTKDLPYGLRLHIIEADRVATPLSHTGSEISYTEGKNSENDNKIHDGVEVDSNGKIVAYHIRNTYPFQSTLEKTEWIRVEAYGTECGLPNVIHVMNSERPDQYRGVTYLAQIIEPLLQIRRYTESELTAAVVESFFTAFIKTELDAGENPFNETGNEEEKVTYDPSEYEMGPGQINVMNPGEDVVFGEPKRPASGFEGFVHAVCIQIGAALEIPADLLLKQFNSSYSASRAALLEAWKAFKMYREWFASDFCNPVYKIWLSEAVARGRIKAPGFFSDPRVKNAWLGCEWVGPSQGQLDPVKEITAEIMAVEQGYSTHENSTIKLNGGDWNANMNKLARENERKAQVFGMPASNSGANNKVTDAVKEMVRNTVKEYTEEEKMNRKRKERILNATPAVCRPLQGVKPYNIAMDEENDSAEITMYGEVVESVPVDWWTGEPVAGLFIVLSDFLRDIGELQNKNSITVRINSIGGELEAGVAIYNRLKEMNNVTTIVDGLAASAASLILQAGSKRMVYNSSQVMAHEASIGLCGAYNLQKLNEVKDMLEAANKQVIAIYEETTGQSNTKLKHMVEKTTWMTGQEIIDNGFADEIITGKDVTMSMSSDKSLFLCNGIPMNIKKLAAMPQNVNVVPKQDITKKEGGTKMTLEEMRVQYPEVVQQIENAARESVNVTDVERRARDAERERIRDIESIEASIADKELVNQAKFGENPMDAKELAFQAMQQQAKLGNTFLEKMQNDAKESGAKDVQAAPNNGTEEKGKFKEEDMEAAVNAAKMIRGGK